ncbi:MAG TPA: polyphosphate kinase 1 [Planctomycetaceae bacterium]|jgi:polyphosphate kinase|nr:polyphosphate kinase 1 [Planctomycetaceae bacterium]
MADTAAPRYLNRELSWLEFNQGVLDEARDNGVPLLERLKFLAISASNLDEFFMVRVGGLKLVIKQEGPLADPSGMSAREQLEAVSRRVHRMSGDQYACFLDLEPQLTQAGVRRLRAADLNERQKQVAAQFFQEEIASVLTPMAVVAGPEFPLLGNQMLHVAVRLDPRPGETAMRFAIIPLGRSVGRFVTLPSERGYSFILLEDVVALHVGRFFPGESIAHCAAFRITRNADLSIRDDIAHDLLAEIEEVLDERKLGACVRLELSADADPQTVAFLQQALSVEDGDIYALPGPLDLAGFMRIADLDGFDNLKYEPWPPRISPDVDLGSGMFNVIARKDVLLIHPYESFEPVVRLIEEAADDPDVLAIKQTLYRTSRNSPIVAALERAAGRGKYVTAIIELKARFDEARNIEWAKNLERAGVQVIYGVKGLKTHAKICIIVRREPHGIVRYVHFGTGNFNEITARIYGDVSLMTSNEEFGADATDFFNAITGFSLPQRFRKIDVAPIGLRERIVEMIDAETERKNHGQKARIIAKFNSLADPEIIEALYRASAAGVEIKLNVRGICCLKPGVPNLSKNITVVSIIDRFLEHSRILHFHHGGDRRVFISSADWMPRNLDRRVELLVPVEDAVLKDRLLLTLKTYFKDNVKGRRLLPDGGYERIAPTAKHPALRAQEALYRRACDAVRRAEQSQRTVFEPHQAPENSH